MTTAEPRRLLGLGLLGAAEDADDAIEDVVLLAPGELLDLRGLASGVGQEVRVVRVATATLTARLVCCIAAIDTTADPLTYDTETLWNGEAGLRGHALGGRATGELTAFYLARQDTQVRDSAGFGGNYRFFTDNADKAHVYGLEAAGTYALAARWSLRATLALMRSELGRFTLANGNTGGGRDLANTPHHGYTIGARYGAERGLFGSAELVGRAEQFDSNNQHEARRAFRVVNATLGYVWNPDGEIPIFERFFLGGIFDVRGYRLRDLAAAAHPARRSPR